MLQTMQRTNLKGKKMRPKEERRVGAVLTAAVGRRRAQGLLVAATAMAEELLLPRRVAKERALLGRLP